jgi:DNA polymerase-3 subunit delta'
MIVAADRLNIQAANAFLKTLEEPPAKSILILLSTEPQRMLETILSRCLRLNFAGDGGVKLADNQLAWIQSFSEMAASEEGGLLGRYRLLGNLLAKLAEIKAGISETLTARSPLEKYDDAESALRDKWEDELSAAIEAEYRRQRTDLLAGLQWWLRDVWLKKLTTTQELFCFPQLAPAAGSVAGRISQAEAMENLRIIEQTQRLLGSNVQEALALEVGLLKLKL